MWLAVVLVPIPSISANAVSYTHLDVYKRQDQEIPDAVFEITAWTKENIEKIMKFLHFDQEKV